MLRARNVLTVYSDGKHSNRLLLVLEHEQYAPAFCPCTSKALFAENQIIHFVLERKMYLTPIQMLT